MDDIQIELMTKDDLSEVAQVLMIVFNNLGENWTLEIAHTHVESNFFGDCHFVARNKDKIVGFIIGFPLIFEKGLSMFVDIIAVLPDYQKMGIGKMLWEKMTDVAKENNYDAIRLLSNPSLESFEWYKEMGYKESGWVEVYKKLK